MRKAFKILIIMIVIISIGFFIQTDYYLVMPGSVEELSEMIAVPELEMREEDGFFLVTVLQQRANLIFFLYGLVHPHVELRERAVMRPLDMTPQEHHELMKSWMQESQLLAKIIALRRAGYKVDIVSEGVEIVEFIENSPAQGILQVGDIIVAIEGESVVLAGEVVSKIQKRAIGEPVILTVRRGSEIMDLSAPTVSHTIDPEKAALRVFIRTLDWEAILPVEIEIDAGPIIGPSAGLMFVLEILNQLLPEDLTSGYQIAGTGTINIDEGIGTIGGVKQKVVAAERAGADYFLVPEENYALAEEVAHDIDVIPVSDLEDVIKFLKLIS